MAVYFVYRCHYGAPSEKYVRRFEYDTVLEWARAVWKPHDSDDAAYEYAKEFLGGLSVYSFGSMFHSAPEHPLLPCPETMEQVHNWFGSMYRNESADGPHHVQVLTDDDELEMAVYVFDDHYRAANPGKADFLLLDGWELPEGDADGVFLPPAAATLRTSIPSRRSPSRRPTPRSSRTTIRRTWKTSTAARARSAFACPTSRDTS